METLDANGLDIKPIFVYMRALEQQQQKNSTYIQVV